MTSALHIRDLHFAYGGRAVLRGLSLDVPPGACVMLLGPNGAGKTTLFSLIAKLLAVQQGTIKVLGTPGIVFQQPALDLDLTVRQNLAYQAGLFGLNSREAKIRMADALRLLDLDARIDDRVRALNGGHRRRVEIARALITKPQLLLLDEPTVGLDMPTRAGLVNMLHGLPASQGVAILWASHLADEVWPEDQLVILHDGNAVVQGRADAIMRQANAPTIDAAFRHFTAKVTE